MNAALNRVSVMRDVSTTSAPEPPTTDQELDLRPEVGLLL